MDLHVRGSLAVVELAVKVNSVPLQELRTICMIVIFVTRFPLSFLTVWERGSAYNTDHEMRIVNILLRCCYCYKW